MKLINARWRGGRLATLVLMTWIAGLVWAPGASAFPNLYTNNCEVCHGPNSNVAPYPVNTCAGCHAHGTHSDDNKNDINVSATPDNTTYSPGATINVDVTGGYRDGWVRVQMWDQDCTIGGLCTQNNVLAEESLYTSGTTAVFPGPVTLTTTAPTTPGTYTWYAGWYGNSLVDGGGVFGLYIPDGNNANHGNELVSFTFDVVDSNTAPVANNDSDTTLHDTAVTIDVLANDTDDGLPNPPGAISINNFDAVSLNGGTVSCTTDCTYTPPTGFVGSDSFSYDVTDGALTSNTATVTIDVTNTAPVANDDVASTEVDMSVTIDVLANDIDADGDAISINTFDATSAENGSVDCTSTTDCQYTPPTGFTGSDTFTYDITDGIDTSNRAIVSITVTAGPDTEPPAVTNPGDQANDEDASVNLQIEATDNVAIASYSATGLPTGLSINSGTGLISGTISFDAVERPDTENTFATTVTVTDTSGNSTPVSFDWVVTDVNRAPNAVDDTASTETGVQVNIDVLANDSDADGDALTIDAFDATSANNGTVSCTTTCDYTSAAGFTGDDSFTYTIIDGFGGSATATVNVTVTAGPDVEDPVVENPGPQSNSETDAVSLQIVATDNVGVTSYTADGLPPDLAIDGNGLISGTVSFDAVVHPALSDTYTVTVTAGDAAGNTASVVFDWQVDDLNRAPNAVDDTASTEADTTVTVDVLANDSDADGDTLTISAFDATSTGGGSVSCTTTCDYTPAVGFSGDDTFTYTIDDDFGGSDVATVTVSVAAAVAVDLDIKKFQVSKNVKTGNPVRITLTVRNVSDVDESATAVVTGEQGGIEVYNEPLQVSDGIGNGSTRWDFPTFTPTKSGTINWTVTITDENPDTATATTTVR